MKLIVDSDKGSLELIHEGEFRKIFFTLENFTGIPCPICIKANKKCFSLNLKETVLKHAGIPFSRKGAICIECLKTFATEPDTFKIKYELGLL